MTYTQGNSNNAKTVSCSDMKQNECKMVLTLEGQPLFSYVCPISCLLSDPDFCVLARACTSEECASEQCGDADPFLCVVPGGCSANPWTSNTCDEKCDPRLCEGSRDFVNPSQGPVVLEPYCDTKDETPKADKDELAKSRHNN
eukprot:scaffold135355_cov28-Attheya_sp.AAC.1